MAMAVALAVTAGYFLSIFLWISFKIMIEKANLYWQPFLIYLAEFLFFSIFFFEYLIKMWTTLAEFCWQWKKTSVSMKKLMKIAVLLLWIFFKRMSKFGHLCWYIVDIFGFFLWISFKAWWFFQLDSVTKFEWACWYDAKVDIHRQYFRFFLRIEKSWYG